MFISSSELGRQGSAHSVMLKVFLLFNAAIFCIGDEFSQVKLDTPTSRQIFRVQLSAIDSPFRWMRHRGGKLYSMHFSAVRTGVNIGANIGSTIHRY